ncbi:hypothetical protein [Rhodohalobacter sp. 614A]|uniref:hypothetical protein n=1 Tax=Rhodohalobacter sp. 614A TaxID=2908649 RepID=UPI001F2E0AC8|nr:hypothetical protein [Rhodohalobacter sp. 614A]
MPLIDRSDLKYDYSWQPKGAEKPRSSATTKGETDSQIFRSEDGDQVLSFINDYTDREGITDKKHALKIEKLLQDELKNRNMSRKEARLWLNENLTKERV